jgi:hypothetical protein
LTNETLGEDPQTRAAFEACRKITGRPGFGGRSRDHLVGHSEDLVLGDIERERERMRRRALLMAEMGKVNRTEMWIGFGYMLAATLGILAILMMAVS